MEIRSFNDTFDRIGVKEAHLEAENTELKADLEDSRSRYNQYLQDLEAAVAEKAFAEDRLAEVLSEDAAKAVIIANFPADKSTLSSQLDGEKKALKAVCLMS